MRVLVTGASGLIGGRLLARLLGDGKTQIFAASRRQRTWPSGVDGLVINADIRDAFDAACGSVDVIINLASMPEAACTADPGSALSVSAGYTLALVQAAKHCGSTRFVQLSTSKVYGSNLAGWVTEGTTTLPVSPYAVMHRTAEDYASQHPSPVILRLSNGFGAPVDPGPGKWDVIVNDFCRQAVTNRRIDIRSDGSAWRNFIPLEDVVTALSAAAFDLPEGTYNLGGESSTTIRAMAMRVARVCQEFLGVDIEVSVGARSGNAPVERLEYRSDRLRAAGVTLAGAVDDEIKRTLAVASEPGGRPPDA